MDADWGDMEDGYPKPGRPTKVLKSSGLIKKDKKDATASGFVRTWRQAMRAGAEPVPAGMLACKCGAEGRARQEWGDTYDRRGLFNYPRPHTGCPRCHLIPWVLQTDRPYTAAKAGSGGGKTVGKAVPAPAPVEKPEPVRRKVFDREG